MLVKPQSAYNFLRFCLQTFVLISYRDRWLLIFPECWHFPVLPVTALPSFVILWLPIVSDSFPDCFHVSANCSISAFPLPVSGFWHSFKVLSVITEVIFPEFELSCEHSFDFNQFLTFVPWFSEEIPGLLRFSDCSVCLSSFWHHQFRTFIQLSSEDSCWLLAVPDCSFPVSSFG